jgi:hypothetical protein
LEGSGVSERVYTGVFDADDADSLLQILAHDPALVTGLCDVVSVPGRLLDAIDRFGSNEGLTARR